MRRLSPYIEELLRILDQYPKKPAVIILAGALYNLNTADPQLGSTWFPDPTLGRIA